MRYYDYPFFTLSEKGLLILLNKCVNNFPKIAIFAFIPPPIHYIITGYFKAYLLRLSRAEFLISFLHFLNNALGGKQK